MPMARLDASGITQEHFYAFLEQEMRKIEQFTKDQVKYAILHRILSHQTLTRRFSFQVEEIRRVLADVEKVVNAFGWNSTADAAATAKLQERVEKAGEDFLKYVLIVVVRFCSLMMSNISRCCGVHCSG